MTATNVILTDEQKKQIHSLMCQGRNLEAAKLEREFLGTSMQLPKLDGAFIDGFDD
jgi:DNA integrity scanning protein DisA with diadenylate cyclase activity